MRLLILCTTSVFACSLTAGAQAQKSVPGPYAHGTVPSGGSFLMGSDSCATPTAISGQGLFFFDQTTATTGTEGQTEPLCYAFGSSSVDSDVWFVWTADADGCATIQTCAQTAVDTKMAIYPGSGCPANGTALVCNDDYCGFQSRLALPVVNGTTYTLQVGTFPGATPGTGMLEISIPPCPVPTLNPANGHYYLIVDGHFPWDTAKADAEATTFMGFPGHLVTISDAQEDQFVYFQLAGGLLGNSWIGLYQDMNDPGYVEPDGGWKWVTNEPLLYENWLPGEPNDGGGLEHFGGYWPAEQWNDYTCCDQGVQRYVIEYDVETGTPYCFGDGSGTACPCGNNGAAGEGCANSSGAGAVATSIGSTSVGNDNMSFEGTNLLPAQPALLFVGLNAVNNGDGLPFGDGLRCSGGSVVRLGTQVPDASGYVSWGPGLQPQGGWQPGDLRRFQIWYRDPFGSPCGFLFNLTNGVEVLFTP